MADICILQTWDAHKRAWVDSDEYPITADSPIGFAVALAKERMRGSDAKWRLSLNGRTVAANVYPGHETFGGRP